MSLVAGAGDGDLVDRLPARVAAGQPVWYLVPDGVVQYIAKRGLYRSVTVRLCRLSVATVTSREPACMRGSTDRDARRRETRCPHPSAPSSWRWRPRRPPPTRRRRTSSSSTSPTSSSSPTRSCSPRRPTSGRCIAIVDAIEERLLELPEKAKPVRREGERAGRWVLLDYVDIVVHVQHTEEREFYALDRLWKDCPTIPFVDRDLADADAAAGSAAANDPPDPLAARQHRLERRRPGAGADRRTAERPWPRAGRRRRAAAGRAAAGRHRRQRPAPRRATPPPRSPR